MKKIFLVLLLGVLLLTSCGGKATKFEDQDLDLFLEKLAERNFTLKAQYQEYSNGRAVTDVDSTYYVDGDVIYRETYTKFAGESTPSITTKVYSCVEDGKYYDYVYQENYAEDEPMKTYVKEEVTKEIWNKNFEYGTFFVTNYAQKFTYRNEKEYYTGQDATTTIKLDVAKVIVNNKTDARAIEAVYSKMGSTKIGKPSFVKHYKKDEIIQ